MTPIRFDTLVKQHRNRVYGFALHYLGDADDAADVTQEVFIRMWHNRATIDEERLIGWLLRVTRNVCVDAYRKKNAYRTRVDTNSDIVMDQADTGPRPDSITSGSLFADRLLKALDTLGEPHRSIVVLREIEEYKYEEISEVLDLPLNTVKVYLHRARKALRKELSEEVRYDYA